MIKNCLISILECQDGSNSENELQESCGICGIAGEEESLYGDIINKKHEEDAEFRNAFEDNLEKPINN